MDLDDTLWGGVVGELEPTGIDVGEEGVGLAFQDFQRELVRLHDTGVLIALCTKNDPEYALKAFDHPSMVLFAARRRRTRQLVGHGDELRRSGRRAGRA